MRLAKGVKYAIKGIWHCVNNERNMRIHTVVALYVLLFSKFFNLSIHGYAILILTISAVMVAEMFNTSIEELADLSSMDYNPMVKIAKDVAAGAVLISAIFSIFVGLALFWNVQGYINILNYFVGHPFRTFMFIISILASLAYIRFGPNGIKNRMIIVKIKR